jgi:TatD DNase family protein
MRFIDTHCHLDSPVYERDLDIVVRHARDEGVEIVTLGNDLESSRRAVEIAERYPVGVYAAVGMHPKHIGGKLLTDDKLIDIAGFTELLKHPKVVAIGETGLDFHNLPTYTRNAAERQLVNRIKLNQRNVFGRFLELSKEFRMPLMLHCRDAYKDMLNMLDTWDKSTRGFDSRGVIHCFSGDWKTARRFFTLDFSISVTGIQTHGAYQNEVIRKTPASRLLIESDCPHMTTTPWSSRRNEPSYLPLIAEQVAAMRGVTSAQISAETTANALKLFQKIPRP